MAVRKFDKNDLTDVLALMKQHAELEGYGDIFSIDEEALVRLGFDRSVPAYHMLVSENAEGKVVGFALYFLQEFTFRNMPMLYMNQLIVDEAHRRQGTARELVAALCKEARALGCFRLKWGVSSANENAIAFYDGIGAAREKGRFYYTLDETVFL